MAFAVSPQTVRPAPTRREDAFAKELIRRLHAIAEPEPVLSGPYITERHEQPRPLRPMTAVPPGTRPLAAPGTLPPMQARVAPALLFEADARTDAATGCLCAAACTPLVVAGSIAGLVMQVAIKLVFCEFER